MQGRETRFFGDYKAIIEIINAVRFKLLFDEEMLLIDDSTCIVSKEGNVIISEGDEIELPIDSTFRSIYTVKIIEQLDPRKFSIVTDNETKASLFLLPLLSLPHPDLITKTDSAINTFTRDALLTNDYFLLDSYFINCFLSSDLKKLELVYRYSESPYYQKFEENVRAHRLFVSNKDITHYTTRFTFNIDEELLPIVDLFIKGKYSFFPENYKKVILLFFNFNRYSVVSQILYKSDKRRKQLELDFGVPIPTTIDLYSIPDLTEEVYVE